MSDLLVAELSELFPQVPPGWAEVFGEDDAGIFAEFVVKDVAFPLRWMPAGRFVMGSPKSEAGRWEVEGPQHEVTITRGFWLGETPVTQAQWVAVMEKNPSRFKGPQRPVEQVSWHECIEFAGRLNAAVPGLGAALPTEAQWEYACRAGTQGAFHVEGSLCTAPEGSDPVLERLGWYGRNSGGETHEVKQKEPNAWGLYDLHGNVWEWCRDGFRKYDAALERDPVGAAAESADRVIRGGGWFNHARYCRAASRYAFAPGFRWNYQGLRLSAGQELQGQSGQSGGAERPAGVAEGRGTRTGATDAGRGAARGGAGRKSD